MNWVYTFHRFDERAAFLAACAEIGVVLDAATGVLLRPDSVQFDEVGPVYSGGVPIAGHHVNAAWEGEMPAAFAPSQIFPITPSRVFA